jgi:hypothetical protein
MVLIDISIDLGTIVIIVGKGCVNLIGLKVRQRPPDLRTISWVRYVE